MGVVKWFSSLCGKNIRWRTNDHFSLDQFYNEDELFTASFSLTNIVQYRILKETRWTPVDHHQDQMFSVLP